MSSRGITFVLIALIVLSSSGCGLLLDPEPRWANDGGVAFDSATDSRTDSSVMDADPPLDCEILGEGEICGEDPRQICVGGVCIASRCGDAILDPAVEACDDGNGVDGDGCEGDCTASCVADADCDDGNECNGAESCTDFGCAPGMNRTGECMTASGVRGSCEDGYCNTDNCQNGVIDPGEQCDDGNGVAGDGCQPDCTFTCVVDGMCAAASGECMVSRCRLASHTCEVLSLPRVMDCYADADRDGWGAGAPIAECRTTCRLGTTPLDGDCDDTDARAHPYTAGASTFHTTPRVSGGYDYDCNGMEEYGLPGGRFIACPIDPMGCMGGGWVGPTPGCGGTGAYAACVIDTSSGRAECVRADMLGTVMPCR